MSDLPDAILTGPGVTEVVHRYALHPSRITVKIEKNSRGVNWEISYSGETVEETLAVIRETHAALQREYGE